MEIFKRVNLTHINEIVLSNPHDAIEVDVAVPVNDSGIILRERIIYKYSADSPEWLRAATKQFLDAVARFARERPDITEDKCSTCTGVCCTKPWAIRVTQEDIERIAEARDDIDEVIVSYSEEAWTGYVGEMARGEDGACVFFKNGGCSQHEIRPSVCREYSAHKCDLYEYDDKKYHLKIAGQDPYQLTRV